VDAHVNENRLRVDGAATRLQLARRSDGALLKCDGKQRVWPTGKHNSSTNPNSLNAELGGSLSDNKQGAHQLLEHAVVDLPAAECQRRFS
jgi:hypothetical protein